MLAATSVITARVRNERHVQLHLGDIRGEIYLVDGARLWRQKLVRQRSVADCCYCCCLLMLE